MNRERETPEYAAMLERMIRSYGQRVGAGDEPDLARMIEVRKAFDEAIRAAVRRQREEFGRSWADIAAGLGTSRQAAQMRFSEARESLPRV